MTSYGPDQIPEALEHLSSSGVLIGHNIVGYDFPALKKLYDWEPPNGCIIEDTYIISRVLNPDRPMPFGYKGKGRSHSLECWGYRAGDRKPDHTDWTQYSPAMLERNRADVRITEYTCLSLRRERKGYDWDRSIKLEHDVQRIITAQECRGVAFDAALSRTLIGELNDLVDGIDSRLLPNLPSTCKPFGSAVLKPFKNNGEPLKRVHDWFIDSGHTDCSLLSGPFSRINWIEMNLGSMPQVKKYLLESAGWVPTEWNYKDGQRTSPKLTEDSYDSITGSIGSSIKDRFLYNHRKSQISGWLERVRDDGRITASANTCGTNTGRFRHSGVVNVPKAKDYVFLGPQMRSLFTCSEGRKFIGHDACGVQLRMLAHYMNDDEFTKAVVNGKEADGTDIHTLNQKLAGLPTRDAAKTFIYAFLFGAGNDKIGSIIGGTAEDGAAIKRRFLKGLPALAKLIKNVKRASKKGYLKGLDGRKVWMRREKGTNKIQEHKALNTLLQSAEAVVMKESMVVLDSAVTARGIDVWKVLDMHDEAQADVLVEDIELYSELAADSLVQSGINLNMRVPLAADVKVGNNWKETH